MFPKLKTSLKGLISDHF